MTPLVCSCGAEVIPGADFTAEDRAAWLAEHTACDIAPPPLSHVTVRFRDAAEARELAPFLRALGLVVGPNVASLFCKPRANV